MLPRPRHRYGFPLSGIACGFAFGILMAGQAKHFLFLPLAILAGITAPICLYTFQHRLVTPAKLITWLLVMTVAINTGGYRWQTWVNLPPTHIAGVSIPLYPVVLAGKVQTAPERKPNAIQFQLNVSRIYLDDGPNARTGLLLVNLPLDTQPPQDGDLIILTGTLRQPPGQRNPGAFDYQDYLRLKKIYLILDKASWQPLKPTEAGFNHRIIVPARHFIQQSIDTHIKSKPSRSILNALMLGDTSGLSDEIKDSFRNTGLMHVLAVSGLHVLLVGMVVYGLLRPLLLRFRFSWHYMEWTRMVLTIMILAIYALITGGHASVVRAVFMASLMIWGTIFQRTTSPFQSLSAAGLLLLFIQPSFLFDIGFQLSFSAVIGILVITPHLKSMYPSGPLPARVRSLLDAMCVSISAMIGTFPVLIQHFGTVSFAGLILNLPALPLTAATLSAGLMMLLLAYFSPLLASTMGATADFFAELLVFTARQGSISLGGLAARTEANDLWPLCYWFFLLVIILNWRIPTRRWRATLVGLLLPVCLLWWHISNRTYTPRLSVLFFDVGHGDAALIHLPNNKTLLIDAGPQYRETDAGSQIIAPFLQQANVPKIDAVVITHPHADHLGGLSTLLKTFPIDRVVFNGVFHRSGLFAHTQSLADSLDLAVQTKVAGDTLLLDSSVRIRVLSPSPSLKSHENLNEGSLVIQIQYGASSLLFLGDAERDAENFITANFDDLIKSNVVKVGHHGSRTSSASHLVERVGKSTQAQTEPMATGNSTYAIISTGPKYLYDLPDTEVLDRWRKVGAKLHLTSENQAFWLVTDGRGVKVKNW